MSEVCIKRFNLNSAKKIFLKLNKFYNKDEVDEWKAKVSISINRLFKKYNVVDYKLNENSYMGIVVDCKTTCGKDVFIKYVPPMINRFNTEIGTLSLLPKNVTCKIYEINYEECFFVMEKIVPGTLIGYQENKEELLNLFKYLNNNKIIITDEIDKQYKDFADVVEYDYNILCKRFESDCITTNLYNKFKKIYKEICKNEIYLLHGDIYKNNVILSNHGLKIIDPLGFKAPFVMELVSICAYEMLYSKEDLRKILNKYIDYFSCFVEPTLYKDALFCQLVKVYIPSIYEANDGGIRSRKWYNIIKELYPERIGVNE